MSRRYELINYSCPVSVGVGEEFTILMTTETEFNPGQRVVCVRETDFTQQGNVFDMPLVGPESLDYTNGSFSFNGLKFEGDMVAFPPWHTADNPPRPLWHIRFNLVVDGIVVATATASIEINR